MAWHTCCGEVKLALLSQKHGFRHTHSANRAASVVVARPYRSKRGIPPPRHTPHVDRVATVIAARVGVVAAGVLGTNHPPVTPGQTAIIDKMRQTVAHFVALCRRYSIVKIVAKVRVAPGGSARTRPCKGRDVLRLAFGRLGLSGIVRATSVLASPGFGYVQSFRILNRRY